MSFRDVGGPATASLSVSLEGDASHGPCELRLTEACLGRDEDGTEVREFLVLDNGQRIYACPDCSAYLLGSGYWVEQPR